MSAMEAAQAGAGGMKTLLAALEHHARRTPYKPALAVAEKGAWLQFNYADLLAETERWARIWMATGAAPGSVVFLILQHCAAMYPAFLGAMRAGLTPAFLAYPTPKQDPALYWRSHQELFRHVSPACVLTYGAILPAIRGIAGASCNVLDIAGVAEPVDVALPAARDGLDAGGIALLQYSSGTTGLKKGVMLAYAQIRDQVAACAAGIGLVADDRVISWLPIYHDMGLIATFLLPLTAGITAISMDAFDWLARPDMFLDEIARFRATVLWMPNFAFNHLVRTRDRDRVYDLSSVRAAINCSEPCKVETVERFSQVFASSGLRRNAIQVCYGMAEVVFAATQTPPGTVPRSLGVDKAALAERSEVVLAPRDAPEAALYLSCGVPLPGVEIRIAPRLDGERRFSLARAISGFGLRGSPPVVVGEIEVRCPFMFDGYFRNPAASAAALDAGWIKSGDMGFLLDGQLYVCGRRKEMLIVHGRNFYANDIEAIIEPLAGVKPGRVVAVGVFDAVTGSEEAVILAETVLDDAQARADLEFAIRQRLYDVLGLSVRRVELASVGTMVKTTSGKISRQENVKRLNLEFVAT